MIVDAHLHAFPHMGGASGYPDAASHLAMQQAKIRSWWGRMLTSETDERYIPLPGEDVGFRAGRFGRYYWTKHGRPCWLQRFPLTMEEMEWSAERMVANMDAIGVDAGLLQAGYMNIDYCREYFQECVRRFPGRLYASVSIDYDIRKDEAHRRGELGKLARAVREAGARALYQGYPKGQEIDDSRFDPFWRTLCELGTPHILLTGFEPVRQYLDSLQRLARVIRRFPDLTLVIGHLGGNVRPASHPGYTATPDELMPLLQTRNVHFEVGYVLAYEHPDSWGAAYEYPYPEHERLIRRVYEAVGADRLLWGSDMPNVERTCTYRQCLDLVRLHCGFLSPGEKRQVLGANAAALFKIDATREAQE